MKNNLLYPLLVASAIATTTTGCGNKAELGGCGVLIETLQKLKPDEVDRKKLCAETFYQVRLCLRLNGFCPEDKK